MEKNKVTVEIYGETYALKGDMETQRVERLAAFLDAKMKEVAKANPRLPAAKIAVLAALNISDEYIKLEQDYEQLLDILKNE